MVDFLFNLSFSPWNLESSFVVTGQLGVCFFFSFSNILIILKLISKLWIWQNGRLPVTFRTWVLETYQWVCGIVLPPSNSSWIFTRIRKNWWGFRQACLEAPQKWLFHPISKVQNWCLGLIFPHLSRGRYWMSSALGTSLIHAFLQGFA